MLRIRLSRVGKKKQPHYRVVVTDIEAPRDGRIVERIGYYSPLTESDLVDIDEGRALYWLSVGAQPTDTVRSLLRRQGTLERLNRLRGGESLEALVAEYKGEPAEVEAAAEPESEATVEAAEETVVEEPETEVGEAYTEVDEETPAADDLAETAGDVVDSAAETVGDAAESAVDAVSDAVDEIVGSEEEE